MQFKAISGYDEVKKHLLNKVDTQQIAHAQLFLGPQGSPNLAFTVAFIAYLHCTNKTATDACGVCSACIRVKKFVHPDLHFAFPIGPTQHIKGKEVSTSRFLPQWRSFLSKNLYASLEDWSEHLNNEAKQLQIGKAQSQEINRITNLKPFESTCKTILVWLPELLHVVAANALLKTLEEPPNKTYFFLVATNPSQLLPTLRSRTLAIHLPPFTNEDLKEALKHQYPQHTEVQREQIVKMAHGDLNKAYKLVNQTVENHFEKIAQWMRAAYAQHWEHLADYAEEFHKQPLQVQKNLLAYGLQLMRAALLVPFSKNVLVALNEQEATFCKKLHHTLSQAQIETIIQHFEKAQTALTRNAYAKLLLLSTLLHVAKLIKGQ